MKKTSIVFAGGGCRTFWSLGVMHQISQFLPDVREWAGVSAGAAMAVASAVGKAKDTLEHFVALTATNKRNVYFGNILNGNPVFPHESLYRMAIRKVLDPETFALLKTQAPVRIFAAYIKEGQPRLRTVFRAIGSYPFRRVNQIVRAPADPLPGMGTHTFVAQDCRDVDEICDKLLISSTTPPFTQVPVIDRCTYVDGGIVDNVPFRALSREAQNGKVLALLISRIPRGLLPRRHNYFFLAPSRPIPIGIWDYTSPEKLEETFRLGQQDAERQMARIESFATGA